MHIVGIGGAVGLSLLLGGLRDFAYRFDSFPDPVGMTAILCQVQLLLAGVWPSGGRVLASTEMHSTLCLELQDGTVLRDEAQGPGLCAGIRRVWLEPRDPPAGPGVVEAIAAADAVVLGPGSLYAGVIANLLVAGVAEAVRNSHAVKVYVSSLLGGESGSECVGAAAQLQALQDYLGPAPVNICLLNSGATGRPLTAASPSLAAMDAGSDEAEVARLGVIPVSADLLSGEGSDVRLDPVKLALSVVALAHGALSAREAGIG